MRCADGTYYTGSSNDLESRIKLHNSGNGAKYLRGKGPLFRKSRIIGGVGNIDRIVKVGIACVVDE